MNDLAALENELHHRDVAAFIVEPIQGKGVYTPADNYLPEAQRLCGQYGTLFICDEVEVGMGRTGYFLCCEHWNLEPEIVTLSKSLGTVAMSRSAPRSPVAGFVTRFMLWMCSFLNHIARKRTQAPPTVRPVTDDEFLEK